MENNNKLQDKLGDKVQDLKQDFRDAKEHIGEKANEWKNDIKEKKDDIVNKVKGSNDGKTYGSSCGCNKQQHPQQEKSCGTQTEHKR